MQGEGASVDDLVLTLGIQGGGAEMPTLASTNPLPAAPYEEKGKPPAGLAKTTKPMAALSALIGETYERNARHRKASGVDEFLKEMLLLSLGRYSAEEEAAIRSTGAPLLFPAIADKKRRAGAAMLGELFNNPGDKCWTLSPTPDPLVPAWVREEAVEAILDEEERFAEMEAAAGLSGPPDMEDIRARVLRRMDEIDARRREFARRACRRMEERIHDQMVEGHWIEAFNRYVDDLCVYGTGIIRGPEPRARRTVKYVEGRRGVSRVKVVEDVALEFEAVSPWDCYPSPGALEIGDGPLVVRVRWQPEQLRLAAETSGAAGGWMPDAVDAILRASPQGGSRDSAAEGGQAFSPGDPNGPRQDTTAARPEESCQIEGLEYFGEARGSELLGVGIACDADGGRIDAEKYYEIDAIRIDDVVAYCRVVEPQVGRALSKGVFYPKSGSWWGVGPMEKCRDAQRLCNAAVRSLAVNMAQASGPQFAINDLNRLDPSCGLDMTPWKVWAFGPPAFGQGGAASPIQMFQPASNAGELLRVVEYFDKMCDELSGIPAYTMGGTGAGEIGRSAAGYSMLMESATRGFKHATHQTDVHVVRPVVMRCYWWNMLHDKDQTIKGDVQCNPAGLMGQILKEQDYNRKMQFLQLVNNPTDMQIVGIPGRARLLREIARPMELSLDEIVKSPETLEREQRMADLRQQLSLAQQSAQLDATRAGLLTGAPPPEGGAEEVPPEGGGDFRGASSGRRTTVPALPSPSGGPGTGMTPQARGTMRYVATEPRRRAMQGMRAAQTRAARRAAS